jgi:RNA-binding protein
MKQLTPVERRALKARAHHLNPIVMIGDAGATPAVLREVDLALRSHELIKIRVLGEVRNDRQAIADALCESLQASPVQHIGKMLVIYRPRPEDAPGTPSKSRRPRRKQPRRTKRSFQMDV